MRMLHRLRTSLLTQMTLVVTLVVLLAVAQGLYNLVMLNRIQAALTETVQSASVLVQQVNSVHSDFLTFDDQANMWVGLRPYGLQSAYAKSTLAQALAAEGQLDVGLAQLRRQKLPASEKALVTRLSATISAYEGYWKRIQHDAYTDPARSAQLMYLGNHQVTSRARSEFRALSAALVAHAQQEVAGAQATSRTLLATLALRGVIILILGILAALVVRRLVRPLAHVADTLDQMAEGQFDVPVEVSGRQDEIGRLTKATAVLAGELRQARSGQLQRQTDLERLVAFNAVLAEAGRITLNAEDDQGVLQGVCELAAQRAGLPLVWVGIPDDAGRLETCAAAGAIGYLQDILVSVQPDIPEGKGPSGHAWRTGETQYVASIAESPVMVPWRERAASFGITGTVVVPVRRGGALWGLLTFHLAGGQEFSPDVRLLLDELARTVSQGLDRLDASARARELATVQALLLDQTYAGISMARGRRLILANRHLVEMLGYERDDELIGQSARVLYASEEEYDRVGEIYTTLREQGVGVVPNVRLARRDGHELVGDITLSLTISEGGETVIWTVHDVTERFELERDLEEKAYHDTLTGLPNKRALDREVAKGLERARRHGKALVVGLADLDGFKTVNGALGHAAGDRTLGEFARRLRKLVRKSEFVARFGGDEFVILLEDFELPLDMDALPAVLARLHGAVEQPIEPSEGHPFNLEMSLGLAVFPDDGADGETLLRRADQALAHLKAHKHDRVQWWHVVSDRSDIDADRDADLDAYDADAVALLSGNQTLFRDEAEDFAQTFRNRAQTDQSSQGILRGLPASVLDGHRGAQRELMSFLFEPSLSRLALQSRALQLGEVHALVGVDTTMLSRAITLYRETLTSRLNQTLLSARQKYRLLLLAERRLQDYLEGELRAMQRVSSAYLDLLSVPLPDPRTRWVDGLRIELEAMGHLPGIAAVLLLRLNPADGLLTVEHSAGLEAEAAERMLQQPDTQRRLILDVGDRPGATVQAWRDGQIVSIASFGDAPQHAAWQDYAAQLGVRSMLAVPVLDASGHMAGGVCLFGQHPCQFESPAMRQFAQSVAQRWEDLWRRSALPTGTVAVPHALARTYRERLFAGGLSMYMQPIVDLKTGEVVKVEALARLIQPDGRALPPGDFLPLLGDVELARLFRQGLDHALHHLASWARRDLRLDVSVNLPPSTLLIPDCDRWVAEALERYGVPPERLTLELLETTLIDEDARDSAIARLAGLGVRLALDDLGAGYSSLRRLSSLPFGMIKIDQGLLRRLRNEPELTLSVMDTLIEMGRRLGRDVVVEGLEDRGTIEVASLLGATLGQGYGLAYPMPAQELPAWRERFRLPIEPGSAHTYLGALAQHWKHGHAAPIEQCPVTAFFREKRLTGTKAARLHAAVHEAQADEAPQRALTAWFLERMQMPEAGDD